MQVWRFVAVVAAGTALTGCGTDSVVRAGHEPSTLPTQPQPAPAAGDAALAATAGQGVDGSNTLDCRGSRVSTTQIDSGPPASTLPESAQRAFAALTEVKNIESFHVLVDKAGYITVGGSLSEQEAPDLGPAWAGRSNFLMATIVSSPSGGESAYGWWYDSDTACELQRTFQGLAAAEVWLDPAFPAPKPSDTTVHLLVSERACASGQRAGDRIKIAELIRDATQVRLAIAIKPGAGSFTCQGIPPEPFSVDLGSPLSDQQLVDSAAYPARPFAPPSATDQS